MVGLLVLAAVAGGAYGFRGQLPFLFGAVPTPTLMSVSTAIPSVTLPPELTPTLGVTATATSSGTAVPSIPGGADKVAFLVGNQLYLMDVDGNNLIQVRTDNSIKTDLHWIHDGRLTYVSRNCVYILDVNVLQAQQVMCFVSNEVIEGFNVSPDGKLAAISIQRTLNIIPFDLEALKKVDTRFSLLALEKNCFYNQYAFREILWSKTGTQLAAHVVDTQLVSSDQIFILNVDIPKCATVGPVRLAKIPGTRIDFNKESNRRIISYDWDGGHLFLLNDSIRNDGFGDLYVFDSKSRQAERINPIDGACCYRDARWSPDKSYIFFVFQRYGTTNIEFYYIPYADLGKSNTWVPIPNVDTLFATSREKPQPALRPIP
jgi:Tol biopolymer transport system component